MMELPSISMSRRPSLASRRNDAVSSIDDPFVAAQSVICAGKRHAATACRVNELNQPRKRRDLCRHSLRAEPETRDAKARRAREMDFMSQDERT